MNSLPLTGPVTPASATPLETPQTGQGQPAEAPPTPGTVADPLHTADFQSGVNAQPVGTGLPRMPGFEMERELGRGGMGVVYRARQMPLNRVVALKMILSGDHAGAEAKTRFLVEAEAIAKVQHPGIVQVYEFGTHQGNPFFALEFVEGGSLDQRLRQGPLPAKEAAGLVAQLADAMQAAHAQGIIHRDLKPANILLPIDDRRLKSEKAADAISPQSAIGNRPFRRSPTSV